MYIIGCHHISVYIYIHTYVHIRFHIIPLEDIITIITPAEQLKNMPRLIQLLLRPVDDAVLRELLCATPLIAVNVLLTYARGAQRVGDKWWVVRLRRES